ncbi:MAG: hypothetical protein JJE55_05595 [Flavobacteriaceae bacterium]|nr:hypothetical protein [Flavobacteriaceae bacterium]
MDFRLIPPIKDKDKFNNQEVFKIPVTVKKIFIEKSKGPIVPVIFDRLDFKTGQMKTTAGITFKKSLDIFNDLNQQTPFLTSAMIYKNQGRIAFKIIGLYNQGVWEEIHDVENLMNKDEKSIIEIFHHHYKKLNDWVGNFDDSYYNNPKLKENL